MDTRGTGINVGDTVTVTCHADYEMSEGGKSRTVVCQSDGRWSAQPQCKPISCSVVPHLANAVANTKVGEIGKIVKYTCDGDLLFPSGINTQETQCTGRGVWYPQLDGCRKRCGPVPYFDHAMVDGPYTSLIDSVVQLRCQPGHRFSGGETHRSVRCLANRQWDDVDDCKVDQCPTLSIPAHGAVSTKLTDYGMVVEVKCDTGYHFVDGTTSLAIECVANSQWNVTMQECQEIICASPPSVDNSQTTGENYTFGDIVSYNCSENMRFMDGVTLKSIICLESGKWNETDLSCAADRCPPLPRLPGTIPMKVVTDKGVIVNISCQPGSLFDDRTKMHLASCDGVTWDYVNGGCKPIFCHEISSIPHATVGSKELMFGSEVNVTCEKGYTFDSGRVITVRCNETGQWDGLQDGCQPVKCGPQPMVYYASSKVVMNATYGRSINYTCVPGYWFHLGVFSKVTNCSIDGEWQPTLINCTDRVVPPKYSPVVKEAAQSEVIGAIALGLVVAVAAVIVATDVPVLMVAVQRLRDTIATW
ncbi:hypothetical protein LSAT2_025371 [Lamellibrachia satsuma]|nr:hypothetical protein LSAT2_025371 [Lamellibrachia satsuma]